MNTHYFERSQGTIAYDDSQGDGELVLMLPGMGALRSEYRYLAPPLVDAGYRVLTADLRGHGESSVDWPEYTLPAAGQDILDLIAYLDAGPAHVIGNSFSPGAAVWAAVEQPQAIRSLTAPDGDAHRTLGSRRAVECLQRRHNRRPAQRPLESLGLDDLLQDPLSDAAARRFCCLPKQSEKQPA
jgi:pimeloyl-ACP methyl ester carboxylesterase